MATLFTKQKFYCVRFENKSRFTGEKELPTVILFSMCLLPFKKWKLLKWCKPFIDVVLIFFYISEYCFPWTEHYLLRPFSWSFFKISLISYGMKLISDTSCKRLWNIAISIMQFSCLSISCICTCKTDIRNKSFQKSVYW